MATAVALGSAVVETDERIKAIIGYLRRVGNLFAERYIAIVGEANVVGCQCLPRMAECNIHGNIVVAVTATILHIFKATDRLGKGNL